MIRIFVLAASLSCASLARAENPVLAADLVGRYWAYRDNCAYTGRTDRLAPEEVATLGRIAGRLGFRNDDNAITDLATDRQNAYWKLWINTGMDQNCRLTLVYLRGLAK